MYQEFPRSKKRFEATLPFKNANTAYKRCLHFLFIFWLLQMHLCNCAGEKNYLAGPP
ncbi:hypothetical protein CLDAP_37100 [Caldilinea aerophila DSM 14535 = NBRC 104270]|uniref:Uncharacterized protein n=1 Tax=Caldilinea aerophila (strain DSM 14535 / JCM 11387 / NBRC 104270 / STL-6-O1) TaxID=926550 RepID=I0I912_CALAS|nr:hypothetical protein CLDAP_37100 [Caldilinea aerophila DSM 14535 = NBRC 104270]